MNCNSGWMNQLETKVRPFLTPIILGENVTLASEQIAILARWIALKVMVAEHDIPDVALTPLTDRIAFWREGEIPAYYRLYVAHNISGKNLYFRRHSHSVAKTSEGPIPPLDGTARNIQVVTMLAGKAVIQAVCARITDFTLENRSQVIGFHDRCRIWPDPPDTRDFPARPRLDLQGINFVATILERYLSVSKVTWID